MPNNLDFTLQAAIRSMEKTIIPYLSNENPLAREQAETIIQLFQFLRKRIPYVQHRDQLEMKIYAEMVEDLYDYIVDEMPHYAESIQKTLKEVDFQYKTTTPNPQVLNQLTEELRSTLSELARLANNLEEDKRQRIESVIVTRSKRLLELQRAWFVPTGLVADSHLVPDLEEILRLK